MNASLRKYIPLASSMMFIVLCLLFLVFMDRNARGARNVPAGMRPPVVRIGSQAEAYAIYRTQRLWGAHLVHFGRHFHLMPFFPHERSHPVPFPIRTNDVRPLYEQGIDSHSWLFIANRNGMVRRVTAVIPDQDFREKVRAFESDISFKPYRGGYRGYSYDMPREVFPISAFSCPVEPIVVNVDAGAFTGGVTPNMLHTVLRQRCSDIRMFVLIESRDDPKVTDDMRKDLDAFRGIVEYGKI